MNYTILNNDLQKNELITQEIREYFIECLDIVRRDIEN